MALSQELQKALAEETSKMQESDSFKSRFGKLIENYLDGMGSASEIAEVIDEIQLTGDGYED